VLLGPLAQLPRAVQQQVLDLMVQLPEVQLVVVRAVLLALKVQSQAVQVSLAGDRNSCSSSSRETEQQRDIPKMYTRHTKIFIDCGAQIDGGFSRRRI
jgi:hypothetical protein